MMRRFDCGGARKGLALHCSLAHGGMWAGVAGHLRGVTLLAPDLPGHGAQPLWDGQADLHGDSTRQAIALAEAEGEVDLIGHSFGATVALRVALERPELVRSLTLIEPVLFAAARAAGGRAFADFAAGHNPFARAVAEGRLAEAAQLFLAVWGDGSAWEAVSPRQQEYVVQRIAQVAALDPVLAGDSAGLLAYMRLESLGVPVLLLEGRNSPPIIAAIQAALAERLPQSQRVILDGAAHMSPVTHADAVAAAVQAHLDQTASLA